MKELKLTPQQGGWLHADWGDGKAWVRFGKDKRDRLTRITEIRVLDPTPDSLRRVPLRRIHAAVTMRGAGLVQLALAIGLDKEPPADVFTTTPEESLTLDKRYRLERPAGKRLDDEFYKNVAHAYQSAVAVGLNPRQAIVEDTGSADATVANWVMQARKRGHLPPAKPGKVSA
jgi:hypothetical protein